MKQRTRVVRIAAILMCGAAFAATEAATQTDKSPITVQGSLPNIHLVSPAASGEWTMPAGDFGNTRYSPLDKINTQNVTNLRVVASASTGIPQGHEGQPLVVNNTLYIVTPFPNNLIALDITKPGFPQKWIYHPYPDNKAVGIACCDVVNRGASFADGKIIYNTLDATTVAVDADGQGGMEDARRRHQTGRDNHHGADCSSQYRLHRNQRRRTGNTRPTGGIGREDR